MQLRHENKKMYGASVQNGAVLVPSSGEPQEREALVNTMTNRRHQTEKLIFCPSAYFLNPCDFSKQVPKPPTSGHQQGCRGGNTRCAL